MTLRFRLLLAFSLVTLSLGVAATVILRFQQQYINGQSDMRLERLSTIAETVISQSQDSDPEARTTLDALWEGYIGVFESDGSLTNVLTPQSDPSLRPKVDLYSASVLPQTVDTTSGRAGRMRTKTVALKDGRVALIGLATTESDDVIARLRATLVVVGASVFLLLVMVLWWAYRLGLRPIRTLTRDAEDVASGTRRSVVDTGLRSTVETAQLGQSINRALSASQQSELMMRRFLGDVSHELRTPLTSLQGYSRLYLTGGLTTDEQVRDAMSRMHAESIRMSNLVKDLLDLNRLESDVADIGEEVLLSVVLRNVRADVLAANPERSISVDCDELIRVTGNEELIFQAVLNLVSNAVRHAGADAHVALEAKRFDGRVRVTVGDNGAGIPSEHLPHVFERFYRVDKGRGSDSGGSGLGLAIVAQIMRVHGGTFGVNSVTGEGTTFWLEFLR